ncbi:MAG: hypothetical protein IM666_09665 [Phenylobacterium sp.]|uniref:hypothetical protein n=1 Tax=Phenylobacterium sp. TaxID=1871053 RepID=UPI0025F2BA8C|nr:hypothetical protein [Phenylobacterium sp.]MCA6244015.1 hypothetical protein [Phenylobacterium sp.]
MNCSSAEGAASRTSYGANKATNNGSNSSARDSPYTSEGRANKTTDICAASSTNHGPAQCASNRRVTAICPRTRRILPGQSRSVVKPSCADASPETTYDPSDDRSDSTTEERSGNHPDACK